MDSPEALKINSSRVASTGTLDLWRDGLICAYEFIPELMKKIKVGGDFGHHSGSVQGHFDAEIELKHPQISQDYLGVDLNRSFDSLGGNSEDPRIGSSNSGPESLGTEVQGFVVRESLQKNEEQELSPSSLAGGGSQGGQGGSFNSGKKGHGSQWIPIGWARLKELLQTVQIDPVWPMDDDYEDEDDTLSVAELAHPYCQSRAGPIFWCHVDARHPKIQTFLSNAYWLHPAVSVALRDENRLISDRMKHLLYEVPVRVAGGLLFELTGHSIGDESRGEEDVAVVLRSWQAQNFLITSMHVKGIVQHLNVLGVMEVQDLVGAGGSEAPKCAQEIISQLASRLARWDDRMSRKHFFGAADEIELKYVNRKSNEDLALLSIILNQEVRRLSTQVIRIKWSLHAREEILHELMLHLRSGSAMSVLDKVLKQTRQMLDEQEAVRDRLFTVQDVMQSNVREKLQERSVRVQHNLAVIGGGGLLLSVIVGLFGINLDGIPGANGNPYAFTIFSAALTILGIVVIVVGIRRLGLKAPPTEEAVAERKQELQAFVTKFQQAAEAHEKVHHVHSEASIDLNSAVQLPQSGGSNDYYVLLDE